MEESENNLKPWRKMTDEEIRKITKEKCQYCKYSRKLTFGTRCENVIMCAYILVEKKRRGCRPDHCDKFSRKKRIRSDIVGSEHQKRE